MALTTKAVRVRKDAIARAVAFASRALKRDVGEGEALGVTADATADGALERVIDRMTALADSWAVAKVQERDELWTALLLAFACRETSGVWQITTAEGRPWLHREGTAASTGQALAACDIEALVAELRAGGATDETPALN